MLLSAQASVWVRASSLFILRTREGKAGARPDAGGATALNSKRTNYLTRTAATSWRAAASVLG